jgi:hypothetical protein
MKDDSGVLQSMQFALTMPALLLLTLVVMQALMVGAGTLVAQREAQAAARGLARGQSIVDVAAAVVSDLGPGWRGAEVTTDGGQVAVHLGVPTLVPWHSLTVTSHAGVPGGAQ